MSTDNEIIKALEEELGTALIINHRFEESNDTENPDDHRFIALLSRTIKLINRQKAEIEYCYEFIEQLKKARNIWDDKCTHQNAEIERLQKLLDDKCDRCIAKDKAEAVKEFAERFENKLNCILQHHFTLAQVLYDLDKTKKNGG